MHRLTPIASGCRNGVAQKLGNLFTTAQTSPIARRLEGPPFAREYQIDTHTRGAVYTRAKPRPAVHYHVHDTSDVVAVHRTVLGNDVMWAKRSFILGSSPMKSSHDGKIDGVQPRVSYRMPLGSSGPYDPTPTSEQLYDAIVCCRRNHVSVKFKHDSKL
ncbi:hypothetical protein EVAR_16434_1 [Eumeta japonica]|uniref:Uncharacterized protein n=1 Tax=Eumeta variegata TaxID=151549 RepID=A0A4C1ULW1_EUMVA|nr:hypothetical protein EVAR_16434_1 [Eumeta japonica]